MIKHAYRQYLGVSAHKEQLTELMVAATREHWGKEHALLQSIPGIGPESVSNDSSHL